MIDLQGNLAASEKFSLFDCHYSFLSCRRAVSHFSMRWGTDCSSSHATDTDSASQLRGWGHRAVLKLLLLALQLLFYSICFLLLPSSTSLILESGGQDLPALQRQESLCKRQRKNFRAIDGKGGKDWKMVSRDICVLRMSLTVWESNFNTILLEG